MCNYQNFESPTGNRLFFSGCFIFYYYYSLSLSINSLITMCLGMNLSSSKFTEFFECVTLRFFTIWGSFQPLLKHFLHHTILSFWYYNWRVTKSGDSCCLYHSANRRTQKLGHLEQAFIVTFKNCLAFSAQFRVFKGKSRHSSRSQLHQVCWLGQGGGEGSVVLQGARSSGNVVLR